MVRRLHITHGNSRIEGWASHVFIAAISGFIPPTKGTAIINGCDIRKNIDGVRKYLGLCPQHNILFDNLTVEEHLWFFAKVNTHSISYVCYNYYRSYVLQVKHFIVIPLLKLA